MESLPARVNRGDTGPASPPAPGAAVPMIASLRSLLSPRSIAFVGASQRANTPGNDMMRMIRKGGFTGSVIGVNSGYPEVEGYPCVPSLLDLGSAPELVVLAVKNALLEETFDQVVRVGAEAAVIFASAYEPGDRAPPLAERLARKARGAGIAICGANCMGFYNDIDGVWIGGFPSPRERWPGRIALIAHSGSVYGALCHNDPRLRFGLAVSPGQEMTTTVADFVMDAVERPEIAVVGLFIETARDPVGFRRALERAAELGKPVVALKVGRTEAAAVAAASHTGAIVGDDGAYEALFDATGVVRVETLDELATTLMLLESGRRARPGGLVSIHDSGGEREMIIDLADRIGVPFAPISDATRAALAARLEPGLDAANPLDAWGTGKDFTTEFACCFEALLGDVSAGVGVMSFDLRDDSYLHKGFAEAAKAVRARSEALFAVATNYSQVRHDRVARDLVDAGVPVLDGTAAALVAVRGAMRHRDFLTRAPDPWPAPPVTTAHLRAAARDVLERRAPLDEDAALSCLDAWGLPTAARRKVSDAGAACEAARDLGWPVVLKTSAAEVAHKSDVGGVRLGLRSMDDVDAAYADISARLGPHALVAAQVPVGVELALGMVVDRQFGPIVMVGAGGVLVELLADRATALAPFGPGTARRLVDRLRVRRLLDGHRGGHPVDLDALCDVIARFSVMAGELADFVSAIDVNPLVCGRTIVAVDALIAS